MKAVTKARLAMGGLVLLVAAMTLPFALVPSVRTAVHVRRQGHDRVGRNAGSVEFRGKKLTFYEHASRDVLGRDIGAHRTANEETGSRDEGDPGPICAVAPRLQGVGGERRLVVLRPPEPRDFSIVLSYPLT